jgi:hypothetical protein
LTAQSRHPERSEAWESLSIDGAKPVILSAAKDLAAPTNPRASRHIFGDII